ncbi:MULTISPECIES: cysteine desulfurase family protein [unclassified Novosphingobium]|uniref:cysteine desulfurase family protein n=1 Tax=unclassified Novosphingobium TaxID=2644732 RepID=UPI0025D9358F|nr:MULTISPECIES: cysteine desulfurase family protein [unclassified Novosphingobium]HQV01865.1 cysteine desulfurase family protein [Novosphingobium sp.]
MNEGEVRFPIYLDHHATTPVDPRVVDAMVGAMRGLVGNPNSIEHSAGRLAARAIECARDEVALLVGCDAANIRFTASASDAIGKALALAISRAVVARPKVAATRVEHPSLLARLDELAGQGRIEIVWLDVDCRGQLAGTAVSHALSSGIDAFCLMMANNEVGTIYPVDAVLAACRAAGVSTIVDATQAAGRLDLHAVSAMCDFLIFSAHKIYGPKGIGALFTADPGPDVDRQFAYAGTPDVPAIVGMGKAARLAHDLRSAEQPAMERLRNRLQAGLQSAIDFLVINGDVDSRLSHSLHISIPGVPNEAMLSRVGHQVAISTGAACASGAQGASHVLRAMALPEALADCALRLSVGRFTTETEIDLAIGIIVREARAILQAREEKFAC